MKYLFLKTIFKGVELLINLYLFLYQKVEPNKTVNVDIVMRDMTGGGPTIGTEGEKFISTEPMPPFHAGYVAYILRFLPYPE